MKGLDSSLIYIIAFLSFAVSLLYAIIINPPYNVDAKAHHRIAMNILQGHGYWEQIPVNTQFDKAIGRSGPLLEFFLAGIYKMFGASKWTVWIAHSIIHAITVILIYKLALLIFDNKKAAIISSLLYGFYPDLIEINAVPMTETTYLFLAVSAIYLFYLYTLRPSLKTLSIFSAIFALAFYAKSTILPYFLIFLIYFALNKKIKHAAISILIFSAIISPWIIRNYLTFGKIIPSRIYGYYTLYVGNHHGATGENEIELLTDAKKVEVEKGVFAVDEYSKKKFFEFVKQYPGEYLLLHLKRLSIYFSLLRPTGFWPYLSFKERMATHIVSGIFSLVLFVFGFSGLYMAHKNKNFKFKPLIFIALITPLPFIMTLVETRYRYQIYPFLALFAGYALSKTMKERKVIIACAAIIGLNTFYDLYLNLGRFLDRVKPPD